MSFHYVRFAHGSRAGRLTVCIKGGCLLPARSLMLHLTRPLKRGRTDPYQEPHLCNSRDLPGSYACSLRPHGRYYLRSSPVSVGRDSNACSSALTSVSL